MRLRVKFGAFLSVVSSVYLAVFSLLVYEQARSSQFEIVNRSLSHHIEGIWSRVAEDADATLASLEREGLYQKIWRNGILIHDSFPPGAGADGRSSGDGVLRQSEKNVRGINYRLLAFYDLRPELESLAALKRILIFGSLAAIALLLPLAYLVSTYLLRPFRRLSRTTSKLNAQSLSFRFAEPRDVDEYGGLVTNFNRLLERLENSFRQARNFATNASHELRTPLTVIRGEAELLLRRPRESAEYRDGITRILNHANSLQRTIKHLLVLAHLQRAETENLQQSIPVASFVSETLESLQRVHPQIEREVEIEIEPRTHFFGDREVLGSIVANLVENALKYSHKKIRVFAESGPAQMLFRVDDDGPGIAVENKSAAFEPFNSLKSKGEGDSHGLGLSITKACIDSLHGTIDLKQSSLGGLAVFVSLPMNAA